MASASGGPVKLRGRLVARFDYDRGSVLCALAGPDRPDRSMDRSDRSADRTGLPLSVALSGLSGLWTGHDSSLRPSLVSSFTISEQGRSFAIRSPKRVPRVEACVVSQSFPLLPLSIPQPTALSNVKNNKKKKRAAAKPLPVVHTLPAAPYAS